MTLDRFRNTADRVTSPFVTAADRAGLTPNSVSVLGLIAAAFAGLCFYFAMEAHWLYVAGGVFVALNGLLDLIDGALARKQQVSSRAGDLLDHVIDRYADVILIAGLAAGVQQYAIGFLAVTGVLLTSYLGTQTQAIGLEREYGGLLGRADRLALIGLIGFVMFVYSDPVYGYTVVGWLLIIFAVVGHLTAIQRFFGAWRSLNE